MTKPAPLPENLASPNAIARLLPAMVFTVIAFTAIINTFLYSRSAATPLPLFDEWYFLERTVVPYLSGSLSLADLFVQRGAGDHSQPLQKLILLYHTKRHGMDFRFDGLVGVGFGVAMCWMVCLQMNRTAAGLGRRLLAAMLAGGVFAVWLSLNANNIYTWPLVTLGFLIQAFTVAFLGLFAWAAARNRSLWLVPAGIVLGMSIDEVAILAIVAATLASLIVGTAGWRAVLKAAALSALGMLVARALLALAANELGTSSDAIARPPLGALLNAEAWKAVVLPLFNSVIYVEHLDKWHPNALNLWIAATTAFAALLHLYFWASVYRMRRAGDNSHLATLAVSLMLVCYALIAGIIASRVPEYGWNYLYQPRYVAFYQIGIVAVLLLMHHRITTPVSSWFGPRIEAGFITVVVAALLFVQVAVSRSSWELVPYLTPYWQNASYALGQLAVDPHTRPAQCPQGYEICDMAPADRARLVEILKSNSLNVFSPGFQMRNRLYPDNASIPGFAENMTATAATSEVRQEPVPADPETDTVEQ